MRFWPWVWKMIFLIALGTILSIIMAYNEFAGTAWVIIFLIIGAMLTLAIAFVIRLFRKLWRLAEPKNND